MDIDTISSGALGRRDYRISSFCNKQSHTKGISIRISTQRHRALQRSISTLLGPGIPDQAVHGNAKVLRRSTNTLDL
jgi:hypothetical protein